MKTPFKAEGKSLIYHEGQIYIITDSEGRDLLLNRLNVAYQKGYEKAMAETKEHSDKILDKFGI